jgi:hypothetical protein
MGTYVGHWSDEMKMTREKFIAELTAFPWLNKSLYVFKKLLEKLLIRDVQLAVQNYFWQHNIVGIFHTKGWRNFQILVSDLRSLPVIRGYPLEISDLFKIIIFFSKIQFPKVLKNKHVIKELKILFKWRHRASLIFFFWEEGSLTSNSKTTEPTNLSNNSLKSWLKNLSNEYKYAEQNSNRSRDIWLQSLPIRNEKDLEKKIWMSVKEK